MSARASFSTGARVAGSIISLGYLTGLVPGPIVAVVGGLALITLGRALTLGRPANLQIVAGLAVLAGALGIGALRWEALDLGEIRGVQAVLGPTVLVEPRAAAGAAWGATAAGLLALGVWLGTPPGWPRTDRRTEGWPRTDRRTEGWPRTDRRAESGSLTSRALWCVEGLLGAFALVSVFWGPALAGEVWGIDLWRWVGLVATGGVLAAGTGLGLAALKSSGWRWGLLSLAAVGTLGAAGLTSSAL